MKKNKFFQTILTIFLILENVHATSLEGYAKHSLQHNLTFQAAKEFLLSKNALSAAAWAMWLPRAELKASVAQSQISESVLDLLSIRETSNSSSNLIALIAEQKIIDFSAAATLKMAKLEKNAAGILYEMTKQKTLLQVSNTYFDVLTAKDSIKAAEVYKKLTYATYQQALKNKTLGLILAPQVYSAKAQYLEASTKTLQANQTYQHLLSLLNQLAQNQDKQLSVLKKNVLLNLQNQPTKNHWIHLALSHNLDLKSLQLQLQILKAEIENAVGKRLPTVSAYALYAQGTDFIGTDPSAIILMGLIDRGHLKYSGATVGLKLSLPISSGGEIGHKVQEKKHIYLNELLKFRDFNEQLSLKISDDYDNLILYQSEMRQINMQVKAEYEVLNNQKLGLKEGEITPLNYLEAETRLYNTLMKQAMIKHNYVKNIIELYYLSGQLNLAAIHKINNWLEVYH